MRSLFLITIFLFCLSSCGKEKAIQNGNSYYPLQNGNAWNYKTDEYSLLISVKEIVTIDKNHFNLVEELSSSGDGNPFIREKLLRCNERNNIELMVADFNSIRSNIGSSKEVPDKGISVWYKFDAKVNESWQAVGNALFDKKVISKFKITLASINDTVFANDTIYTNCYKFYIDDLYESDTEYYEWYANDIGLVKRVFQNESNKGFILTSFKKAKQ